MLNLSAFYFDYMLKLIDLLTKQRLFWNIFPKILNEGYDVLAGNKYKKASGIKPLFHVEKESGSKFGEVVMLESFGSFCILIWRLFLIIW